MKKKYLNRKKKYINKKKKKILPIIFIILQLNTYINIYI